MEVRMLRYFLTLVHEENITKAAERLHITQPTLSRQLMELEEELGVQLFKRGKGRITLTDEGMLLRRRAEEIVDLTTKTEREFSEHKNLIGGEISIGAGETYSMHLLAKGMRSFSVEYPSVKYRLYSGNADDIKERIDKGLLDLGLLLEPVNIEKYDWIKLPAKETWGVVMRKDSPLADKAFISAEDLARKPIFIPNRNSVRDELKHWFGDEYKNINIAATFNLIYNAAVMVEEGLGYAVTLENLANVGDHSEICFIPLYPRMETGAVIVWKKNEVFSLTVNKFIESLKTSFREG